MKTHTDYVWVNAEKQREFVNITQQVKDILANSKIKEGLLLVSSMHGTSGIYINHEEPGLQKDMDAWLEKLAPSNADYYHIKSGDTNADGHLKCLLVHLQAIVPITRGEMDLGPWQQIFYAEFDGKRKKQIIVKVIGE